MPDNRDTLPPTALSTQYADLLAARDTDTEAARQDLYAAQKRYDAINAPFAQRIAEIRQQLREQATVDPITTLTCLPFIYDSQIRTLLIDLQQLGLKITFTEPVYKISNEYDDNNYYTQDHYNGTITVVLAGETLIESTVDFKYMADCGELDFAIVDGLNTIPDAVYDQLYAYLVQHNDQALHLLASDPDTQCDLIADLLGKAILQLAVEYYNLF